MTLIKRGEAKQTINMAAVEAALPKCIEHFNHTKFSIWEKNGMRRVYINHNYAGAKVFIDLNSMTVNAIVDCPNQTANYMRSQEAIIAAKYEAAARYLRIVAKH